MNILTIVFLALILFQQLRDDSPYIFENILRVKVKSKPFISLSEMKNQLKITENPDHIKELKRVIKNRK